MIHLNDMYDQVSMTLGKNRTKIISSRRKNEFVKLIATQGFTLALQASLEI